MVGLASVGAALCRGPVRAVPGRMLNKMMTDEHLLAWWPDQPAEARALVRIVADRARARGLELPAPQAEPDNCCGNGCIECVWQGHYQELMSWRDDAVAAWA